MAVMQSVAGMQYIVTLTDVPEKQLKQTSSRCVHVPGL